MNNQSSQPLCFPKEARLLNKRDFEYLKKDSIWNGSKSLFSFHKPNRKNTDQGRIGLAVSKKVGKANQRNRLKRILREEFRIGRFRSCGQDILFVVSAKYIRSLEKLESETVEQQIKSDFKRIMAKITRCS